MTGDREELIATLPGSARKTLAAIETAIGSGVSAAISYDDLASRFGIGRASVRYALRILASIGLITIGTGRNRVSVFSASDAWQKRSSTAIARAVASARLPRPVKGRNKTAEPKRGRPVKNSEPRDSDEPDEVAPAMERQTPSLPVLRFMQGWDG